MNGCPPCVLVASYDSDFDFRLETPWGLPLEALEAQVLQLPRADRVRLLDRVVASLDVDAARDAAWDEEAARRDAQAERDPSVLVPLDEALARLRAQVR